MPWWNSHAACPSYVQGYYDRDNQFYLAWDKISRSHAAVEAWLADWVYGVTGWEEYLEKLAAAQPGIWERLAAGSVPSEPVNYGRYGMRG